VLGAQQRLRPVGPAPLIGGKGIKEQALERRKTLRVPRACSYRNLLSHKLWDKRNRSVSTLHIFAHNFVITLPFSSSWPSCQRHRIRPADELSVHAHRRECLDAEMEVYSRCQLPVSYAWPSPITLCLCGCGAMHWEVGRLAQRHRHSGLALKFFLSLI